MTQPAVPSPADVVEFLVAQHNQIKSLVTQTISVAARDRPEPFSTLRRLLAVHQAAEELIIHPRAERDLANGHQVVDKRLQEERQINDVLAELEVLDIGTDEFLAAMGRLRDAALQHTGHEETEEFTRMQQALSSDERERMSRAVELADAVAPTRPQSGGQSRAADRLDGPFAAMADRARDAILGKG